MNAPQEQHMLVRESETPNDSIIDTLKNRLSSITGMITLLMMTGCGTPSAPATNPHDERPVSTPISRREPVRQKLGEIEQQRRSENSHLYQPQDNSEKKGTVNEMAWKTQWHLKRLKTVENMSESMKRLFEKTERVIDRTIAELQLSAPEILQDRRIEGVPILTERLFMYCDINMALVDLEHATEFSQKGQKATRDDIRRELHDLQFEWRPIAECDPEYSRLNR